MVVTNRVAGFCGKAPIKIYDNKNRPFYIKERSVLPSGRVYFNLPTGKYITENTLEKLHRPIHYKLPPLPIQEWQKKIPKITIKVEPNPHKCSVFYDTGIIILDPSFAKQTKPSLLHILFHEIGHFLYKTEWKCDIFSSAQMLKRGYNPSQCTKIVVHNLSGNKQSTVERAERNMKFLSQYKNG